MKNNKLFFFILSLLFLCSCGKVTSETGVKGKKVVPKALIVGRIEVSSVMSKVEFDTGDKEIYVELTKLKANGDEEELAWGKAGRVFPKPKKEEKVKEEKKSWKPSKSIIDKSIKKAIENETEGVVTKNKKEPTINILVTVNSENEVETKEKVKEKEKEEAEKKIKEVTKDVKKIVDKKKRKVPTKNILSYSYDKRDKKVTRARGNLIHIVWIPGATPHWEYSIKDVKKGPAYFIIRAYNKGAEKVLATFVDGNAITTSNIRITIKPMDILSTFRSYVLICGERNDGRIEKGKFSLKNLKKRVSKSLLKKLNYTLPDLRVRKFKNKSPNFKIIPKSDIESELAEAILKEDNSFDQYKLYVENIQSSILPDNARQYLLLKSPPKDKVKKESKKSKPKESKEKKKEEETTIESIEGIVTENEEEVVTKEGKTESSEL